MAVDLTGGIDPARELIPAQAPDDPEVRDSVSFWVVDDRGEIALPRVGIEAVASRWDERGLQFNLAFPDGRAYRLRADGPAWSADPAVLGAGPLGFRCVEPFRTWTMTFDGAATETSTADMVAGRHEGPSVDVSVEVEATMAVPPWIQGEQDRDLMGGDRYEQLFRASGSVRLAGETHDFTGTGLRIRRQGVRRLAEFRGHAWQSALFPNGRAFGYIAYPSREDGQPTFNEGFVFDGDGDLVAARAIEAPWLRRLVPRGEAVPVVLETDRGEVRIEGETVAGTFDVFHDDATRDMADLKQERAADFPALHQAAVRYRWDGEETLGMLERSAPLSMIER